VAWSSASFKHFCEVCETLSQEKSKKKRAQLVADYLKELCPDDARIASRFLLGAVLSRGRKINIGGSTFLDALRDLTPLSTEAIEQAFSHSVDFGEAVAEMMASVRKTSSRLSLKDVEHFFENIQAQSGQGSTLRRKALLTRLLSQVSSSEAKWIAKIVTSEMRHGVNLGIFIDALAILAGTPREIIEDAVMVTGNPDELACDLLREGRDFLTRLTPSVFTPLRPMLAEQAEDPRDAFDQMEGDLIAEMKLDGLRAQVHKRGQEVRIFSRSLRDLTEHLPEIVDVCRQSIFADEAILDGEVIATDKVGNPLPFQILSKRITAEVLPLGLPEDFDLRLYLFDILMLKGEPTYRLPLHQRHRLLRKVVSKDLITAHLERPSVAELEAFFSNALNEGHEGIMVKHTESPYRPGTRGRHWLKVKRKITLDLVIIAAEYGYGRRHGWLSNYLLAVRDQRTGRFLPVGKTFKGLSDAEFETMTARLKSLKISEKGGIVVVRPEVVVEVSFGEVQRSRVYESGYALRFARIERIRDDKKPTQIDTLDTLIRLSSQQRKQQN